jgi:hypothetical protein
MMTLNNEQLRSLNSFEDVYAIAWAHDITIIHSDELKDPRDKRYLKALASAPTEEIYTKASAITSITYANHWIGIPVMLVHAWAHPSDYPDSEYDDYAYVYLEVLGGETILCIGGNAGKQALTYNRLGRLPSKRILTSVEVNNNPLYVWRHQK